jgi:hypothetical protein
MQTRHLPKTENCATMDSPVKRRIPLRWAKLLQRLMSIPEGEHIIKLSVDNGIPRWSVAQLEDWES